LHDQLARENDGIIIRERGRSPDTLDATLNHVCPTTMVLMDQVGLTRVFAFDEDFRKVGYLLVPSD
jgi:hypothetical protein